MPSRGLDIPWASSANLPVAIPARRNIRASAWKQAEPLELIALLAAKIVERPASAAVGSVRKASNNARRIGSFRRANRLIVDQRRIAAMGEVALEVRRGDHCTYALSRIEFRNGRYLDEQNVEKKPTRRRIRACPLGASRNIACSGLSPITEAPRSAATSAKHLRSPKSPMPQLCFDRSR
jgi:hypothetical protein